MANKQEGSPMRGAFQPYYYNPYVAGSDQGPVSPLLPSSSSQHQYSYQNDNQLATTLGGPVQHALRSDAHDAYDLGSQLVSPIMSRSPSVAGSDRHSVVSGLTSAYFAPNPQNVNPKAAYVAPLGAAQVVTEHRAAKRGPSSDDEGSAPSENDCSFGESALALVNAFLDQLLFSFLSTARSTNLAALRPAVNEVLKAKLAREAVASAEEELSELLAGGEEEEENTRQNTAENNRRWDLELVWKRTRLRVMVYMRLGEMEDDDEERYVQEEELFHASETRRFSQSSGLVSWAAAIFLTGVLEYIAEQTLQISGNAAFARVRRQSRAAGVTANEVDEESVVVEEYDVEKVALNSGIGRLWRTWRKTMRSTAVPPAFPIRGASLSRTSNDASSSMMSHRLGSVGGGMDDGARSIRLDDVPEMEHPEHVLASNIPLPMGHPERDIAEIEVPGLAKSFEGEESEHPVPAPRRNSFVSLASHGKSGRLLETSRPDRTDQYGKAARPPMARQRSMSVPASARAPIPVEPLKDLPGAFPEDEDDEASSSNLPADKPGDRALREGALEHDEAAADKAGNAPYEDAKAEQKANAQEMAPHKGLSQDVKQLLDPVTEGAPTEDGNRPDATGSRSLAGVAVATGAAVTGAAAALFYGSKDPKANAVAEDPAVASYPASEDVDKRKSLIDLKDIIAAAQPKSRSPAGPEVLESRKASLTQPSTPLNMDRTGSAQSDGSSKGSRTSYTLGENRRQPAGPLKSPAMQQQTSDDEVDEVEDPQKDGIGVARTSDVLMASPTWRTPRAADEEQTRDSTKRSTRLILGSTPPRNGNIASDSPIWDQLPKNSPQDFLRSRSLASPPEVHRFTHQDQPAPLKIQQKRSSISGAAFSNTTAAAAERSPQRQSFSIADQQRGQDDGLGPVAVPTVQTAPDAPLSHVPATSMQGHPVIPRMDALKPNDGNSNSSLRGTPSLTSASIRGPEDFDQFVQGADTMKYTLTPVAVRDESYQVQTATPDLPAELPGAPSVSRRSDPPPVATSGSRTGRSQDLKRVTTATSNGTDGASATSDQDKDKKRESRRSVSKPPARNTSTHQRSGLMAREPRVQTESTRDFADFIRSTGPSADTNLPAVAGAANRSTTSLNSTHSGRGNGSRSRSSSIASQDRTKSLARSTRDSQHVPPVPSLPNKTQKGMEPRGAKGVGSSNTELIDFIRSGPGEDGQHRISRSVAPFRSTMDSDQLKDIGDRINGDGALDLRLVTGLSTAPSRSSLKASSIRTSANSRSQLLHNDPATVHPAHSGRPQRLGGASSSTDFAPPERKRHRNKDPYAIDLSGEDDDDLLTALPPSSRKEESLTDFLNSMEPPKDNAPRRILDGDSQQARGSIASKSRANSLATRRSSNATNSPVDASARTKSMQSLIGPRPGPGSVRSGISSPARTNQASPDNSIKPPPRKTEMQEMADFFRAGPPADIRAPSPDDLSAPAPSIGRQSKLNAKDTDKARKKIERDMLKPPPNKDGKTKKGFFSGMRPRSKTWLDA